jgi:ABC-2 type transport system permease protein
MSTAVVPDSVARPQTRENVVRVLRYEVARLATIRSTYVLVAAAILASLVPLVAARSLATSPATVGVVPDRQVWLSVATAPLGALAVVVGVLGAMVVGHEFRYSTMQLALMRCPNRSLLLGAKLLVASTLAVVLSVVSVLLGLAWVSLAYGWTRFGGDAISKGDVIFLLLRLAAAALFWVVVGFTVACWTQSLQLGIALPLIWANVVEPFVLLSGHSRGGAVSWLLPYRAARDGVTGSLGKLDAVGLAASSLTSSIAVCSLLGLALLALSFRSFLRSDV